MLGFIVLKYQDWSILFCFVCFVFFFFFLFFFFVGGRLLNSSIYVKYLVELGVVAPFGLPPPLASPLPPVIKLIMIVTKLTLSLSIWNNSSTYKESLVTFVLHHKRTSQIIIEIHHNYLYSSIWLSKQSICQYDVLK